MTYNCGMFYACSVSQETHGYHNVLNLKEQFASIYSQMEYGVTWYKNKNMLSLNHSQDLSLNLLYGHDSENITIGAFITKCEGLWTAASKHRQHNCDPCCKNIGPQNQLNLLGYVMDMMFTSVTN